MKQKKKVWGLIAASALIIIVVVVLVVVLTSASGPGGTPTPTYTASPGPTATNSVGPLPTGTCEIYFDKTSYVIENGETFTVTVMISNVNYLTAGQFDILYDKDTLNVAADPSGGTINDMYDRTTYGNPATGCSWQSVGPIYYNGIDIGYGNAMANSGCLRILWTDEWAQAPSSEGDCAGGDGTGQCGDGYLATFTFKGMRPGTSEIAFTGKKQVHQIVDWVAYQDYPYPCNPYPPVFTPTPCVPDSVLTWGGDVSVTVQ